MKILVSLVMMTAFIYCKAQQANFTISTTGTSNLKITFAGKKYSLQDRTVTFQQLTPGTYPLTVFQLRKMQNGNMEYVTVFDRNITLTSYKHTELCVMRFGKVTLDDASIEKDDWNENASNPSPADNNYGNNNGLRQATASEFTSLRNTINGEYSDADKLRMAKVVLKNYLFSAVQLKEICNGMYSDQTKLEFAKFGYDFCYDRGNYYTLAETLYSSSYRKQFLDYIGNK